MSKPIQQISGAFLLEIKSIIGQARTQAVRSVESYRVEMYWKLGERIFEEEQQGKERAEYGSHLIKGLAEQLTPEFGSGFSIRQLERCRQFYRLYLITSAVRTQLNWMQYRMFIQIEDASKREFYELETVKNAWTGREMERLPENNQTILASQYKLYLPTEQQLLDDIKKVMEEGGVKYG